MLLETQVNSQARPLDQDVELERAIDFIFPFGRPPDNVLQSTYLIVAPELQWSTAFHQTSSSTLLFTRPDGKVLVPAVALHKEYPSLNLGFLLRETMPETFLGARRWAVWLGRNILNPSNRKSDYTPERAADFLKLSREIKTLYQDGILQGTLDKEALRQRLSRVVEGFWLQHYADDLPDRIETNPSDREVMREVEELFQGFEQDVGIAESVYCSLGFKERSLLEKSFNLIFYIKLQDPKVFLDDDIPTLLTKDYGGQGTEPWRNPKEIISEPRGVMPGQIIGVYIPDDIQGTERVTAIEKLEQVGIPAAKVREISSLGDEVGIYENCLQRYENFTAADLVQLIRKQKLIHISDPLVKNQHMRSF